MAMRNAPFALAVVSVLLAGCGAFEHPGIPEPFPAREAEPVPTRTPTTQATPTLPPTPTQTPTILHVKLPKKCREIIDDVKLTDLLKHRQLFSIALQLEFKGRKDEAIAVLQQAVNFRPEHELTRMKLAQLMRERREPEKTVQMATGQDEATDVTAGDKMGIHVEEPPPGLDLPADYLDIVNSAGLNSCAKGFKLFILASELEGKEKTQEALFVYRKGVSFCPGEDGPNATINRQALTRITLLEKRIRAESLQQTTEGVEKSSK